MVPALVHLHSLNLAVTANLKALLQQPTMVASMIMEAEKVVTTPCPMTLVAKRVTPPWIEGQRVSVKLIRMMKRRRKRKITSRHRNQPVNRKGRARTFRDKR